MLDICDVKVLSTETLLQPTTITCHWHHHQLINSLTGKTILHI